MTRESQKEEEYLQTCELWKFLGIPIPARGDVDMNGDPDVVFSHQGTRIGVEVTKVYNDRDVIGKPPQAMEAEANSVVQEAMRIAVESGCIPPQVVGVRFKKESLDKNKRKQIATDLFEFVRDNFAPPEEYVNEFKARLPAGVSGLSLYGVGKGGHRWRPDNCGWVNEHCNKEIQQVLFKKEILIPRYLSRCDEVWVLIVALQDAQSTMLSLHESLESHEFKSGFRKAFFLDCSPARNVKRLKIAP